TIADRPHPEERPEGPRLEGWGRPRRMRAASCFETPHFVRLLSMRPRKARRRLGCRDAEPYHEAEETSSLGLRAYHDAYPFLSGGAFAALWTADEASRNHRESALLFLHATSPSPAARLRWRR